MAKNFGLARLDLETFDFIYIIIAKNYLLRVIYWKSLIKGCLLKNIDQKLFFWEFYIENKYLGYKDYLINLKAINLAIATIAAIITISFESCLFKSCLLRVFYY